MDKEKILQQNPYLPERYLENCYISDDGTVYTPYFGSGSNMLLTGEQVYQQRNQRNQTQKSAMSYESVKLTLLNKWTYGYTSTDYAPTATRIGNTVTITGAINGGVNVHDTIICYLPIGFYSTKKRVIQRLGTGSVIIMWDGRVMIYDPLPAHQTLNFSFDLSDSI